MALDLTFMTINLFDSDMVPVIVLLFCLLQNTLVFGLHSFHKILLPSVGSESYAFDSENGRIYTGLNDGRIVKFHDAKTGFVDFATTVSNRPKKLCDGTKGDLKICGKPIGLEFNQKTKELYIIDAYLGLLSVGKEGGVATQLSRGSRFDYADAFDIDTTTGVIYFTDVGDIFSKNPNFTDIIYRANDRGGKLLKYDPKTKKIDVLLKGLAMPVGLAISKDGAFVLISEYLTSKLTRFWVKGPKANTSETFVELPGHPDNIRRASSGDFWVAVNILKLQPTLTAVPLGQKISAKGRILQTVNFNGEYNTSSITEVQEHLGTLYVASLNTDFVGVYKGF